MRTVVLLLLVLASVMAQAQKQEKQSVTKEECDSVVLALGKNPVKLRSTPFKQLQQTEAKVFQCASTYETYQYSVTDASLLQVIVERFEDYIRERGLDAEFFAWDTRLSRK